uniref:Uncharacterized protein isoform X4 n=1 Tax=Nicotiana tabacum TaxID=4097 RepID=A0A1S3Z6Z7_TOBAC|nr:PREDICTED: uncharacterized protein LOC107783644 isoform X4 [Nicotiana tabacum]
MSTVKKHLPSACCAQKRKQQCSTEIVSKINRRRRDLYKQLSVDKKELLLTRRRSKKLELKKGSTALLEYTKQAAGFELHTEKTLTIVEAPCIAGKGISSAVGAVVDCHKGKNIGSTSGAPCDRHHVETSTVINKGSKSKIISWNWNIRELPTDATILKTVPDCKYCGAKRFEYELPAFCCSNGSVKLTSHEMPNELLNLYLGNTEESEHFRTYLRLYNNMFAFTSLGVHYDKVLAKRNQGIYTFRVQGQMYHFINDLIPTKSATKKFTVVFLR